jgi:ADP-ribose pyrophosphatase YjhB (NUDIX family)
MIICKFEDGGEGQLRHVTVDGLVINNEQILLVKRSFKYAIEAGKWAMPGGYLGRDESADQAIIREILEETGYQATISNMFSIVHSPRLKGDDRQNVGFTFVVNCLEKTHDHDDEISETQWFKLDNLPENEIGFDHLDTINLYKLYLKKSHSLPFIY